MTIAISAKNKLRFVDSTVEKPNAKKTTKLTLWQRCNNMVLMWIVNVFTSDISSSVVYLRTVEACSCGAAKCHSELAKTTKGAADSHGPNKSYGVVHGQYSPFHPSARYIPD